MIQKNTPVFAIIGHPNEGKSSVLSTLSENDSIRVSPMPGETTESTRYPMCIDNEEQLVFIDTPGFQNPHKALDWIKNKSQGTTNEAIKSFIASHENQLDFHDDCQLLQALLDSDGVIFVVDGTRPVRDFDHMEMEIMRLSGTPRMAVMNNKGDHSRYIKQWEDEFRKHFNSVRHFNSNKADFHERLSLLNSLKFIDQNLEQTLNHVISCFEKDWNNRIDESAEIILKLLKNLLTLQKSVPFRRNTTEEKQKEDLLKVFEDSIKNKERKAQNQLRSLFKHERFDLELGDHSVLNQDLFSDKTWEFLGLTNKQLIIASAIGGAAVGLGVDAAFAGTSHGVFAAIGGIIGGSAAAFKGKELLSGKNLFGIKLDQENLKIGPISNHQFMYILIDRFLLYFEQIIHWSHGRRNYDTSAQSDLSQKIGPTHSWDIKEHKQCQKFFVQLQKNRLSQLEENGMLGLLQEKMLQISTPKG